MIRNAQPGRQAEASAPQLSPSAGGSQMRALLTCSSVLSGGIDARYPGGCQMMPRACYAWTNSGGSQERRSGASPAAVMVTDRSIHRCQSSISEPSEVSLTNVQTCPAAEAVRSPGRKRTNETGCISTNECTKFVERREAAGCRPFLSPGERTVPVAAACWDHGYPSGDVSHAVLVGRRIAPLGRLASERQAASEQPPARC